jgi:hypothetical protein
MFDKYDSDLRNEKSGGGAKPSSSLRIRTLEFKPLTAPDKPFVLGAGVPIVMAVSYRALEPER